MRKENCKRQQNKVCLLFFSLFLSLPCQNLMLLCISHSTEEHIGASRNSDKVFQFEFASKRIFCHKSGFIRCRSVMFTDVNNLHENFHRRLHLPFLFFQCETYKQLFFLQCNARNIFPFFHPQMQQKNVRAHESFALFSCSYYSIYLLKHIP